MNELEDECDVTNKEKRELYLYKLIDISNKAKLKEKKYRTTIFRLYTRSEK